MIVNAYFGVHDICVHAIALSIRQALIWLRQEAIELPSVLYGPEGRSVLWKLPGHHAVNKMLRNPTYGGAYAYAYGRTNSSVPTGHVIQR